MYVTKIAAEPPQGNFDWSMFFSDKDSRRALDYLDARQVLENLRRILKENDFDFTLSNTRMLRSVLKGIDLKDKRIVELGAATGFLTRWLINEYGGRGVLVDSNEAAHEAFKKVKDSAKEKIEYRIGDIFNMPLEKFDVVCSFGLIEHFKDKTDVIRIHRDMVADGGIALILVPMDSKLSRAFYEVHPELNLGYRELWSESELVDLLRQNGFDVVRSERSFGYAYDFVAAVCTVRKERA